MQILDWQALNPAARRTVLARPAPEARAAIAATVAAIVAKVRAAGDAALLSYTQQFDGVALAELFTTPAEFARARESLGKEQHTALERAIANVSRFHAAQQLAPLSLETEPGVICERITRPIDAVGLYVPAGSAPLPSAVIMLAVPARLAGVTRRIIASPPGRDGDINSAVLVAAELCGIDTVLKVGGAQAIAALAYGTESVAKVDKILGPGNAWVTAAKQLVASDPAGAAIDMPAGPSEVLVIADETARAEFVAADLLAQAEHDPLSQAILLTTSGELARQVAMAIARQITTLSRQQILRQSIANSRCLVVPNLATALSISNDYAPEHLILATVRPRELLAAVRNAGSVFLGTWSPEPLGDYCSGTNHVLPTFGYARAHSGVSLDEFQKRITVQELTPDGLRSLGPTAATLARLEGLDAHASAVDLRLAALGAA
ncbi:MAG: histidinol dehydrogenase [Steroidobacteraceae bacterium]